jgi:hypothetical protein
MIKVKKNKKNVIFYMCQMLKNIFNGKHFFEKYFFENMSSKKYFTSKHMEFKSKPLFHVRILI